MNELLSPSAALREAWRCLQCWDAPCTAACPVHVPIPEFIARLRADDIVGAEELVRQANPLISSCGDICPDEDYCSRACLLKDVEGSVRVRELHGFVTESAHAPWQRWEPWKEERVAVIGAGPAGIACARELARFGYHVFVFEKENAPGGILRYALAADRFPIRILDQDLALMQGFGITWKTSARVDSLKSLLDAYDAVFYGIGRHEDATLGLPDEESLLSSGLSFLRAWRTGSGESLAGKNVVVIGGGNVSLDVASTAVHAGADSVVLIYRRGPKEMPVWKREREHVEGKGVRFEFCTRPTGFITEGGVLKALQCRRTRLIDTGKTRLTPQDVEGYDFLLPADLVIGSVGMNASKDEDVELGWKDKAYLPVDENMRTEEKRLFAGGDLVSGEGTVVAAQSHGIRAAEAIHALLQEVRS